MQSAQIKKLSVAIAHAKLGQVGKLWLVNDNKVAYKQAGCIN